ncbi:MAG: hypothetical protein JO322_00835 [Candidatus Eremiobacteraeota bacterium]|nr:hypothetical protein [Candidatus Eremiobacteraeota bacterium]
MNAFLPVIAKRSQYTVIERPSLVGTSDGPIVSAVMCIANNWRSSVFGARILNRSRETLYCSVYGETSAGLESIAPYEFRVGALGIEDFTIRVPRRMRRKFKRVIVSMRAATLEYTMSAPVPPFVRRAAAIAAVVPVAAAAFFGLSHYATLEIGAPPEHVLSESLVQIPYAAFGIGALRYDVFERSRILRSGSLPLGRGTISYVAGAPGFERVRLSWQGFHTASEQSATVAVQPTPAPQEPPEISTLTMERSQVTSGESIAVRYALSAASARVALVDSAGKTVFYVPLERAGTVSLPAPAVTQPSRYTVRIEASRGGRTASSAAQVIVAPQVLAVLDASQPLRAHDLVQFPSPYAVAGKPFAISIIDHRVPIRMALQAASGTEIARTDAPAGVTAASFDIPKVSNGPYSLVITVDDGAAQQSVVMPVPVRSQ